MTAIPEDIVWSAWEEFVYPLTAVERPKPSPGFARAIQVIDQWLARRAVVDLPEPGNGDDCWYVGESDIHGYQENGEPGVCHNLATLDTYPPVEARALAAALLAAADRAEQLADEHNAALQDAEEVSRGGL